MARLSFRGSLPGLVRWWAACYNFFKQWASCLPARGIRIVVVRHLAKVEARVRFSYPAPFFTLKFPDEHSRHGCGGCRQQAAAEGGCGARFRGSDISPAASRGPV